MDAGWTCVAQFQIHKIGCCSHPWSGVIVLHSITKHPRERTLLSLEERGGYDLTTEDADSLHELVKVYQGDAYVTDMMPVSS